MTGLYRVGIIQDASRGDDYAGFRPRLEATGNGVIMDVDLRNTPSGAFSNIPDGGFDVAPGARWRLLFSIGQHNPTDITVSEDGSVDCGPDWDAVTGGGKIIGFNRRRASVTADA